MLKVRFLEYREVSRLSFAPSISHPDRLFSMAEQLNMFHNDCLTKVLLQVFPNTSMSLDQVKRILTDLALGKKPNKAPKCGKCGNYHIGECLPRCETCGNVQGACRYAKPTPTTDTRNAGQWPSQGPLARTGFAGQGPSQEELAARYNAQEAYQQGMRNAAGSMVLGMVSSLGGNGFAPAGGFGGPFPGQFGGFGGPNPGQFGGFANPGWGNQGWGNQGWGNQGWGMQVPGQIGQGYGTFPTPNMGQSGLVGKKEGAAEGHEIQKRLGVARGKPHNKEQAVKSAGIAKPISESAKMRARKQASKKKKEEEKKKEEKKETEKEEEDEKELEKILAQADPELLRRFTQPRESSRNVQEASVVEAAPIKDEDMVDMPPPVEAEIDYSVIDAQSLIDEINASPTGFQLPQDQTREVANLSEQFGQDIMLSLSESAAMNGTSIVWEAVQQNVFQEQMLSEAAQKPLPEAEGDDEL